MKYRPQRGSLEGSMNECVELDPSISALAKHLNVRASRIGSKLYDWDDRIGWNTYLISVDGQAVGFADTGVSGE